MVTEDTVLLLAGLAVHLTRSQTKMKCFGGCILGLASPRWLDSHQDVSGPAAVEYDTGGGFTVTSYLEAEEPFLDWL